MKIIEEKELQTRIHRSRQGEIKKFNVNLELAELCKHSTRLDSKKCKIMSVRYF